MTDRTELADRLDSFARAYPEDMFPPLTDDERRDLPREIIDRCSAAMGRHFAKFASEAADALRQSAWQPIESAPKDANGILVYREGWVRPRTATFSAGAWWTNNAPLGDVGLKTVWMHIPHPPADEVAG